MNSVSFVQTKNTITIEGTSSAGFFRTLQSGIQLTAGKTYYFAVASLVTQDYIILLYHGEDLIVQYWKYVNYREYTFTPEEDMTVEIKYYMSSGKTVDDTKTLIFTETEETQEKNTVAEAVAGLNKLLFLPKTVNIYTEESVSNIVDNYVLQNGLPVSAAWSVYYYISDFIPVVGGKTINFSFAPWTNADSQYRAAEYDSTKTFIKNITTTEHTLSDNAAYIRFNVTKSDFGGNTTAALKYINDNLLITDQASAEGEINDKNNIFLSDSVARKCDTYFVDAKTNELLILWKMEGSNSKDVGVKFKSFTNNNAYQFCSVGTVQNDSDFVGNIPQNYTEYQSTAEDWFSPIKVDAVNNVDGDTPSQLKWSGGFHMVDGVNTSRRVSLDIYFDGRKRTGFVGYCKTIDIVVVHQLVASNTFKEDGTGREVIKETIHVHFEDGKINVETTYKALEPVKVYVWYFLQSHHKSNGLGSNGIRYIGSEANRGINSMEQASDAGDLYARTMRLLSDTVQMEMTVDDYDIGRFSHALNYSAFVRFYNTYSKPYFNMIDDADSPLTLDTGESFTAKGSYKFGIFE